MPSMIRHIALLKARSGHDSARMQEILEGLLALQVPGLVRMAAGADRGLREGNWDYAIVSDLEDAEAYRRYDADAEHNRLRGELAQLVDQIARCQIEI
jgi:hypothetical protein